MAARAFKARRWRFLFVGLAGVWAALMWRHGGRWQGCGLQGLAGFVGSYARERQCRSKASQRFAVRVPLPLQDQHDDEVTSKLTQLEGQKKVFMQSTDVWLAHYMCNEYNAILACLQADRVCEAGTRQDNGVMDSPAYKVFVPMHPELEQTAVERLFGTYSTAILLPPLSLNLMPDMSQNLQDLRVLKHVPREERQLIKRTSASFCRKLPIAAQHALFPSAGTLGAAIANMLRIVEKVSREEANFEGGLFEESGCSTSQNFALVVDDETLVSSLQEVWSETLEPRGLLSLSTTPEELVSTFPPVPDFVIFISSEVNSTDVQNPRIASAPLKRLRQKLDDSAYEHVEVINLQVVRAPNSEPCQALRRIWLAQWWERYIWSRSIRGSRFISMLKKFVLPHISAVADDGNSETIYALLDKSVESTAHQLLLQPLQLVDRGLVGHHALEELDTLQRLAEEPPFDAQPLIAKLNTMAPRISKDDRAIRLGRVAAKRFPMVTVELARITQTLASDELDVWPMEALGNCVREAVNVSLDLKAAANVKFGEGRYTVSYSRTEAQLVARSRNVTSVAAQAQDVAQLALAISNVAAQVNSSDFVDSEIKKISSVLHKWEKQSNDDVDANGKEAVVEFMHAARKFETAMEKEVSLRQRRRCTTVLERAIENEDIKALQHATEVANQTGAEAAVLRRAEELLSELRVEAQRADQQHRVGIALEELRDAVSRKDVDQAASILKRVEALGVANADASVLQEAKALLIRFREDEQERQNARRKRWNKFESMVRDCGLPKVFWDMPLAELRPLFSELLLQKVQEKVPTPNQICKNKCEQALKKLPADTRVQLVAAFHLAEKEEDFVEAEVDAAQRRAQAPLASNADEAIELAETLPDADLRAELRRLDKQVDGTATPEELRDQLLLAYDDRFRS